MKEKFLNLLVRSMDSELSEQEQQQLADALAESEDLQREQKKLLQLRSLLQEAAPQPDAAFANRVLSRLQPENFSAKVIQLFPRVAAACAVIFALTFGVLYTSGTENWVTDEAVGVEDLSPEDAYSYLNEELAINQ